MERCKTDWLRLHKNNLRKAHCTYCKANSTAKEIVVKHSTVEIALASLFAFHNTSIHMIGIVTVRYINVPVLGHPKMGPTEVLAKM